jgi:hypothetical protein
MGFAWCAIGVPPPNTDQIARSYQLLSTVDNRLPVGLPSPRPLAGGVVNDTFESLWLVPASGLTTLIELNAA